MPFFRQMVGSPEIEKARFDELVVRPKDYLSKALRNAFTTPLPAAGNVTTRVYDQNGNYLGSERNSRTEAELKGAR